MNEFIKILDKETMFYYVNKTAGSNFLETSMICLTIAFLIWTIVLAVKDDDETNNS